jgi:hypothetical protein
MLARGRGAGVKMSPMVHVIGRTADLHGHARAPGHAVFDDVHSSWSLARNGEWIEAGVRRNELFLQISPSAPGSMLAWEIERLHDAGYVQVGPIWAPAMWQSESALYRNVVSLVADHVIGLDRFEPRSEHGYRRKAEAELAPLLDLWPHVLAVPTTQSFTQRELILRRALPVHPLGVVAAPAWADGMLRSPAEFFFHDLDHARFKIREDLAALGVVIPDAYQDGSTFDPVSRKHRSILHAAIGKVGPALWQSVPERTAVAHGLVHDLAETSDRVLADASELLLFELVHEKSFPIVPAILLRELSTTAHLDKLRHKHETCFFGPHAPSDAVIARLEDARSWLESRLRSTT